MLLRCAPRSANDDRVLVCFPPVGAGGTCFNGDFARAVDARCFAVDVPGRRGAKEQRPWAGTAIDLATVVAREIEDISATDDVIYLYGHSAGAWVAFECARALAGRVSGLYVSGARAPCLAHWLNDLDVETPRLSQIHNDDAFWAAFERRYGLSNELRATQDSMIDSLRCDFRLCESYEGSTEKLDVPLTAIGIKNDNRYDAEMIARWSEHTTGAFRCRWWDSGGEHPHRALIAKPLEFASFLSNEVFFV